MASPGLWRSPQDRLIRGSNAMSVQATSSSVDSGPVKMSSTSDVERRFDAIEERLAALEKRATSDQLTLMVFSGELDRLLAAFVTANGAAACGMEVVMFFTFWSVASLKRPGAPTKGKTLIERMFGRLLPGGLDRSKLSRLDFCGLGRRMMRWEMARKNIADLPELIESAGDLGVKICVCEMSLSLLGIRHDELIDYPHMETCGVTRMVDYAAASNATLFV